MVKTDIIIPQYNNSEYTIRLLESIAKHTKDYRIILVDNGSDLDELSNVSQHLGENDILIANNENLGFVKGVNMGIARSTADYIVIQNNDTLVEEGWLDKMLKSFYENPNAGIVGPTTVWADSWQNKDSIKKRVPSLLDHDDVIVGGMLAFFCAVISRDVIKKVGYLSEEYGMGFGDDDDYCERVKLAGYTLHLRTDVCVPHYHRTTFNKFIKDWEVDKDKNLRHFKDKWGK